MRYAVAQQATMVAPAERDIRRPWTRMPPPSFCSTTREQICQTRLQSILSSASTYLKHLRGALCISPLDIKVRSKPQVLFSSRPGTAISTRLFCQITIGLYPRLRRPLCSLYAGFFFSGSPFVVLGCFFFLLLFFAVMTAIERYNRTDCYRNRAKLEGVRD